MSSTHISLLHLSPHWLQNSKAAEKLLFYLDAQCLIQQEKNHLLEHLRSAPVPSIGLIGIGARVEGVGVGVGVGGEVEGCPQSQSAGGSEHFLKMR